MDPDRYCQELVAKRGSNLHYSCLFLSKEERVAVYAIHAYFEAVFTIPWQCDPTVASKKLTWWREEVEHLYQGKPNHPITQALLSVINRHPIPKQLFIGVIDGTQQLIDYAPQYLKLDDLLLHCHETASLREMICGYLQPEATKEILSFCRDIGVMFRLIDIIANFRTDLDKGFCFIPHSLLQHFHIEMNQLQLHKTIPEISRLLKQLATVARKYRDNALKHLADIPKKALQQQFILEYLYDKLLVQLEDSEFAVLEQHISLPPLRKLWYAMRAYKKLAY